MVAHNSVVDLVVTGTAGLRSHVLKAPARQPEVIGGVIGSKPRRYAAGREVSQVARHDTRDTLGKLAPRLI